MSNLLNLTDAINEGYKSGKTPTFIYEGTVYEFSPAGLLAFMQAEGGFADVDGTPTFTSITTSAASILILPTADPEIAGALWNNAGTVTVSAGA